MTTRDIRAHLAEVYGAEVSPECRTPGHIVTGVDVDGFKHVLGLRIGTSEGEGAKY